MNEVSANVDSSSFVDIILSKGVVKEHSPFTRLSGDGKELLNRAGYIERK